MMGLFDEERIMKTALKSERHEADRKTAVRMFTDREPIEKIARYLPTLSLEELKEIEAEVMQLA